MKSMPSSGSSASVVAMADAVMLAPTGYSTVVSPMSTIRIVIVIASTATTVELIRLTKNFDDFCLNLKQVRSMLFCPKSMIVQWRCICILLDRCTLPGQSCSEYTDFMRSEYMTTHA